MRVTYRGGVYTATLKTDGYYYIMIDDEEIQLKDAAKEIDF